MKRMALLTLGVLAVSTGLLAQAPADMDKVLLAAPANLRAGAIRTDYWNWGAGFISAYPPDQFIMLEKGATYGTRDTQIWAPYYTLHKILAGLLDSYEVACNKKALEIARGMGTWAYTRLKALPAATLTGMWGRYIAGEYGGMNEAMARLYRLTGDKSFLECAKLFDNTAQAKSPTGPGVATSFRTRSRGSSIRARPLVAFAISGSPPLARYSPVLGSSVNKVSACFL